MEAVGGGCETVADLFVESLVCSGKLSGSMIGISGKAGLASGFKKHCAALDAIDHIRIAAVEFIAGALGVVQLSVMYEVDDAVGEIVEVVVIPNDGGLRR